jgi:hypothetical protein
MQLTGNRGWDQASINGISLFYPMPIDWATNIGVGANLGWPKPLGLQTYGDGSVNNTHDTWIFAFVNAAPFLFAAVVYEWPPTLLFYLA